MSLEIPPLAQGALAYLCLELIKQLAPKVWDRFAKRREQIDETLSAIAVKKLENGAAQRHEDREDLKEARKEIRALERENIQLMAECERQKWRCSQLEERNKVLEERNKEQKEPRT